MLSGIAGSAGIGIGRAVLLSDEPPHYTPHPVADPQAERGRFDRAAEAFGERTRQMAERVARTAGEKEANILRGQMQMMADPVLLAEIRERIGSGTCAEAALEEVCGVYEEMFRSAGDELTRQRAADVRDIRTRMLRELLGAPKADLTALPAGSVVVAEDLTPSMTAGIDREHVVGIVTETGGKTSHSAILARALGIPAVLSVSGALCALREGDTVVVDGAKGEVVGSPDGEALRRYTALREADLRRREELRRYRGQKTRTADGAEKELFCNIGRPNDIADVLENDGEGIGLLRTEFLFMDRPAAPSEEEQLEAYRAVAVGMKGRPVIIRTLDVGGDKDIPYLNLQAEQNPFLGFRAVRYCLGHTELFKTQLRALLRAAVEGDVRILIPLVTAIWELRAVKALVNTCAAELEQEGIPCKREVPIGVMIETPAAAETADLLAKEAAFFSIGTNDLIQYMLAVDRGNARVEYLYSPYDPAVLRAIRRVIQAAESAGIPVGMCGEAAADPLLTPLLLSFGLREFSVTPAAVLETRRSLSMWSKQEADAVTAQALRLQTAEEVCACLKREER